MAYRPDLDNNYRLVGDRILSERTYQEGLLFQALYELLPFPANGRLLTALSAATLVASVTVHELGGAELFVLLIAGVLAAAAGVFSYILAPLVLYGSVAWLAYAVTDNSVAGLALLLGVPFAVHVVLPRLTARASGDEIAPVRSPVRKPSRRQLLIVAAVLGLALVGGGLVALVGHLPGRPDADASFGVQRVPVSR